MLKRFIFALSIIGSIVLPARATDFLWDPGTSNNGQIVSTLLLFTGTDINSLTNSTAITASGVTGETCSSGLCTNSNTGQGIWGYVQATLPTVTACSANASITGWWLVSLDGSTFEPTATALSRPPDFIIPLPASTLNATYSSPLIRIPALKFKQTIQNNCGQALNAAGNSISLGVAAVKY